MFGNQNYTINETCQYLEQLFLGQPKFRHIHKGSAKAINAIRYEYNIYVCTFVK